MGNTESLQRRATLVAVATLCAGAFALIVMILSESEFDEGSARVICTAIAFALYLLFGISGQTLTLLRSEFAWFGRLTMLTAGVGFILMFLAIWVDWAGDHASFAKFAFIALTFAWAAAHSSILLRSTGPADGDGLRLLRAGTICAAFLLAILISAAISSESGDGWQAGAVLAVLYVLGTILLPLARRLEAPKVATGGVPTSAPAPAAGIEASAATVPLPISADVAVRRALASDAEAIAAIYNQGIEGRQATFQTKLHDPGELELKVEQRGGLLLVAEVDDEVVGWAGWTGYDDPAEHYAGVGECAVYVARDARRTGVAAALLGQLAEEAPKAGLHKFVAKIFTSNQASIELFRRAGYREVGLHRRHGRLEGEWKDVLVLERLLDDA